MKFEWCLFSIKYGCFCIVVLIATPDGTKVYIIKLFFLLFKSHLSPVIKSSPQVRSEPQSSLCLIAPGFPTPGSGTVPVIRSFGTGRKNVLLVLLIDLIRKECFRIKSKRCFILKNWMILQQWRSPQYRLITTDPRESSTIFFCPFYIHNMFK